MDLGWGRDTDVEYNQVNKPATDMLYSGEQYDTPLQMQYLRARYYDQSVGGFNRLDDFRGDMSEPQSLHKYAYCQGDPVNSIDPSGRMSVIEKVIVISLITILVLFTLSVVVTTLTLPNKVGEFEIKSDTNSLTFTPKTTDEFYEQLRDFAKHNGKIKYLSYEGHAVKGVLAVGGPNSVGIGPTEVGDNLVGRTIRPIIKEIFEDDAEIDLLGCYTADERGWGKEMADILPNAEIYGFTGPSRSLVGVPGTWARNFGCPWFDPDHDEWLTESSWVKIESDKD